MSGGTPANGTSWKTKSEVFESVDDGVMVMVMVMKMMFSMRGRIITWR